MFLDASTYDTKTPEGQNELLQAIIDEQNRQNDRSQSLVSYNIVAYQQLDITIIGGSPAGNYTTQYLHGQDFPPLVLAYGILGSAPALYNRLPFIGLQFAAPDPIQLQDSFWVDDNYLYFNRFIATPSLGESTSAGFYISNLPAIF